MSDAGKTREELLAELAALRARLAEREAFDARLPAEHAGRFLKAILETTAVLVSALDRDHRFLFWNEGAERITGYPREQVLGTEGVLEVLYPEPAYREEVSRAREAVMQGRPRDGIALRVRTKGGEERTLAFYSRGVWDEGGQPLGLVNVAVDVTESFGAEEALRRSEERFRSLFTAMTEGVALHTLVRDAAGTPVDYTVDDANPAYETHTRIRPADAAGRLASELYGAGEPPYLDRFARVAETGEPDRFETFFPPMGKHFRVIVVSPGRDRFATVFEDITERKGIEEALAETNAALSARNEELDAYARTVAHDLKMPVSAVAGYAELLAEGLPAGEADERAASVEAIARSARRMLRIIDELLLLGDVRRTSVEGAPLEMGAVVADALKGLEHFVEQASARVLQPPSWPAALGHAPWVEQVWINYVSNAVKYGGRPPRVELGFTRLPDDGHVSFWVKDDGDGVPPGLQPKLFTPFTRLDARGQGHGLGLSIVRRIVEKMGGRVGVESTGRPGEGSTFSFTLPAA
ncbi:MAG: PAS domain-containing sensor histidine kinase [Acidobacteria bacterium]|nr:MAG: PAS domain-containing sensor histidine kinase [Acidobacteriota bacterium]